MANGALPVGRRQSGWECLDLPSMEWQPADIEGFYTKVIFEDKTTGETTSLMKMDAGAFAPSHNHEHLEEILVLEGDFYDDKHAYSPGQYCQRAIGAMHSAGSRNGGVVLILLRT